MQPFHPSILSSLQAMLNRNGGLIACLSAYATLSNAFQLPALEPQMKIHSTYFWGKMLRSDALRNKIYLMSFNLTVVLSQLLNRGRHMYSCGSGAVYSVCACQCRCVYKSSYSCWDLALKKKSSVNPYTTSQLHYSPQRGKNNIAFITSSSPVWENHRV